jgi:excisionase family DNA binding protein
LGKTAHKQSALPLPHARKDWLMPDVDHGSVTLEELIAQGRNFAEVWEVASIMRCDRRTVRTAISLGEIPATKAGVRYKIPVSWLRQQAEAAGPARASA